MGLRSQVTIELPDAFSGETAEGTRRQTTPAVAWQVPLLVLILALAAVLNFYQLDRVGYANTYYAAAVRSMTENWHAFFFNSFDPAGFVTIDKPPLGFWFQVLSAKILGYSAFSLLLPQALAGVLSVLVLYRLVRRWYGPTAGLIAALTLTVTPVAVVDNRNNIIDSTLTLFLLLSAWAVIHAVETGKLRWLFVTGILVGLGFNIKMLEAYLIVPALGLVYLVGAPISWPKRLVHLLLATLVMLVVSFSWVMAVDLTPANQRPYVDSTSTNSELDLAIGYNGLERLLGMQGFGRPRFRPLQPNASRAGTSTQPGSPSAGPGQSAGNTPGFAPSPLTGGRTTGSSSTTLRPRNGGGGGGLFDNGTAGPLRLLDAQLGGQAGWLLPLALFGLVAASARKLRYPLTPPQRGLVLWGAWLLTEAGFFSVANFFHSYYLVTMAPPAAALVGIGVVALWREYCRTSVHDWRGWLLPIALVATGLAQAYMLQGYPDWRAWLTPLLLTGSVGAAAILVIGHLGLRGLRLWLPMAAAVGMSALLVAPTVWAAETVGNSRGGGVPSAGPSAARGFFGGRTPAGLPDARAFEEFAQRFRDTEGGFGGAVDGDGSAVNAALLHYLEQHQGTTTYLFATTNSNAAAPSIIQTGKAVMSLGGFSGSNPILTVADLKTLIANNTVRYFLLNGFGGFGGFGGPDGGQQSLTSYIESTCTAVPSSAWQGTSAGGTGSSHADPGGFSGFDRGGGQTLYDCASTHGSH